jgi:ABC-type multidrug transport system fused ATPase/permease subunit
LKRRQLEVRLVTSLVTLVLVFFGTLVIDALALLISTNLISTSSSTLSTNFNNYIQQHPSVLFSLAGPAFLTAPVSAIVVYFVLRWRQGSKTKELSSLISQMKIKLEEYDRRQKKNLNQVQQGGIIEAAFSLTDQILVVLPGVARKRMLDSLLFGLGAFILTLLVSQILAIALVVGVAVGLYSTYETRRSYEREIAKFEEQERNYEQRKDDFLATL